MLIFFLCMCVFARCCFPLSAIDYYAIVHKTVLLFHSYHSFWSFSSLCHSMNAGRQTTDHDNNNFILFDSMTGGYFGWLWWIWYFGWPFPGDVHLPFFRHAEIDTDYYEKLLSLFKYNLAMLICTRKLDLWSPYQAGI